MAEDRLVHASCVACRGRAILIIGPSGSGKSDLALRLIDRGARLVSDDQTLVTLENGRLLASPPRTIQGLVEVRGLGHARDGMGGTGAAGSWPSNWVLRWRAFRWSPVSLTVLGQELICRLIRLDGFHASTPLKVEFALADSHAHECGVAAPPHPAGHGPVWRRQSRPRSRRWRISAGKFVDNLPFSLLDRLLDTSLAAGVSTPRPFALGIDTRTRGFDADAIIERIGQMRDAGEGQVSPRCSWIAAVPSWSVAIPKHAAAIRSRRTARHRMASPVNESFSRCCAAAQIM
jgi:hypothetical protein